MNDEEAAPDQTNSIRPSAPDRTKICAICNRVIFPYPITSNRQAAHPGKCQKQLSVQRKAKYSRKIRTQHALDSLKRQFESEGMTFCWDPPSHDLILMIRRSLVSSKKAMAKKEQNEARREQKKIESTIQTLERTYGHRITFCTRLIMCREADHIRQRTVEIPC